MIDIKLLLNEFERVKGLLEAKNVESKKLDSLREKLGIYKETLKNLESLRAAQNTKSKDFFEAKKSGAEVANG